MSISKLCPLCGRRRRSYVQRPVTLLTVSILAPQHPSLTRNSCHSADPPNLLTSDLTTHQSLRTIFFLSRSIARPRKYSIRKIRKKKEVPSSCNTHAPRRGGKKRGAPTHLEGFAGLARLNFGTSKARVQQSNSFALHRCSAHQ